MCQRLGNTRIVCPSTLKVSPRFGSNLWVNPAELRWTHQHLFTDGNGSRMLRLVFGQCAVQPSKFPVMGIVRHEKKVILTQQPEDPMFQIGQSVNGGGPHTFGRYCFSAQVCFPAKSTTDATVSSAHAVLQLSKGEPNGRRSQ